MTKHKSNHGVRQDSKAAKARAAQDPPPPPKPERKVLTAKDLALAATKLAEYDAMTDYRQRIGAHHAMVEQFGVGADALRYKLAMRDRATGRETESERAIAEARAQLEAQKIDAHGAPVKGKPEPVQLHTPNAIATRNARGGRQTNGTLGVAEAAVTPASKRGGPRAPRQ